MPTNYSQTLGAAGGLIGGPIGAGIGSLVGAGIGLLTGGAQKRKARALINQPYPEYSIPTEAVDAASQGLPSEQYNLAMKNIQRQQANAIGASQDRRSGIATIGRTQQLTNDATAKLDAANSEARMANQRRLAGYRDKAWDWNVKNKYVRDYNYGMNLLGAGNQNTNTGLDKAGAGLGLLIGGGAFNGLIGRNGAASGNADYSYDDSLPQY